MPMPLRNWNAELSRLALDAQSLARAEDFSGALEKCAEMIKAAEAASSPDALATAYSLRGDALARLRRFDEASAAFDEATRHASGHPDLGAYIETQRLVTLMRRDPHDPDLLEIHLAHVEVLRTVGDRAMLADVLSNTGVLHAQRGEQQQAADCFAEAEKLYRSQAMMKKAVDSRGAWASAMRAMNRDSEAVPAYVEALEWAVDDNDQPAIARIGGDLARTLLCILLEKTDGVRERAAAEVELIAKLDRVTALVDHVEESLWQQANMQAHGLEARIARGLELFNNVETALNLDVFLRRDLRVLARSTMTKSRILVEDILEHLRPGVELVADEMQDQNPVSLQFRAASTAWRLGDRIASRSGDCIALIDHFGMSGNELCVTVVSAPCKDLGEAAVWGWTDDVADASYAGALHGAHQVREPVRRLKALLEEFERIMNRVPYLIPEGATAIDDAGVRASLTEEHEAVRPHLRALGEFFFPNELRVVLRQMSCDHVVLSPDPRLFHVPWYALEFADGSALIDEPWSLSLTPSLDLLYGAIQRSPTLTGQVVVASPDPEVTERFGGQQALDYLGTELHARQLRNEEATLSAWANALQRAGIAHVTTHGDAVQGVPANLPLFFDGPWVEPVTPYLEHPALLVSIACRTGSVTAVAQDLFGLAAVALRSGIAATIAPTIVVDGVLANELIKPFYEALRNGATVGHALREACRMGRERFVHPALWSTLQCVGDHALRLATPTPGPQP